MEVLVNREADPLRAELDDRWKQYLSMGRRADDHDRWLLTALSSYRDEIVHYGAQLLNDLAIRPWDATQAQAGYERYQGAASSYDSDPEAWEARYWTRIREAAPVGLYSKFDGLTP
jgi:hypothetical protein